MSKHCPILVVLIVCCAYSCVCAQAPADGLVGHWMLNDAAGAKSAVDSSPNQNSASCATPTDIGGSQRTFRCPVFGVPGKFSTSAQFQGAQALTVKNTIPDSFTVALWMKTTGLGSGQVGGEAYNGTGIVWADKSGGAPDSIPLALMDGHIAYRTGECPKTPGDTLTSKAKVNNGQWVHVVVTRDMKTGGKQIFINGALDISNTKGGTCTLNAVPVIAFGGNVLDGRYYTGSIDDVYFYNRALTAAEIKALMTGKEQVKGSGLRGFAGSSQASTPQPSSELAAATARAQVTAKIDDKPVNFKPQEKTAFIFMEAIADLEDDCGHHLKRVCPIAELLKGPVSPEWPIQKLKFDPASDPNYIYVLVATGDKWDLHARPKKPGLAGFYYYKHDFSTNRHFNPSGPATDKDPEFGESGVSDERFLAEQ